MRADLRDGEGGDLGRKRANGAKYVSTTERHYLRFDTVISACSTEVLFVARGNLGKQMM
jgi:hypothetical protein